MLFPGLIKTHELLRWQQEQNIIHQSEFSFRNFLCISNQRRHTTLEDKILDPFYWDKVITKVSQQDNVLFFQVSLSI